MTNISDETKEAVRLLFECMYELYKHDEYTTDAEYGGHYRTDPDLKRRLEGYVTKIGLANPAVAAAVLHLPE